MLTTENRQCIFSVFGGSVDVTGEILHGKTSPLRHDGRGLFAGLPQDLPVTRYHSLAGTHLSLPECLEVSSWIAGGPDEGKGIIMGVRHRELAVEGVQFHPESILTAEGRAMLSNFLKLSGGTWKENEQRIMSNGLGVSNARTNGHATDNTAVSSKDKESKSGDKGSSILEKIYTDRMAAVELQKITPSLRYSDLQASYDLGLSPPLISFPDRIRRSPFPLSLAAEVKRASPSKGDIAPHICAPAQARKYAVAGASVISVLTEPKWFKGSIDDLRAVRQALAGMPDRPAILRKEFILDEYQILEARVAGADTVLLIVKMLAPDLLQRLYRYSKSLGMEPLVEINTPEEMNLAKQLGAQVIGINNRNLTNFEVDLETASRLMTDIPQNAVICALSGISGPQDVEAYKKNGVRGVLVGEALMRHKDTAEFVRELMGGESEFVRTHAPDRLLVKICGTRSAEAARAAIASGADLVGIIMVEGRKRTVPKNVASEISRVVHETPKGSNTPDFSSNGDLEEHIGGHDFFDLARGIIQRRDRALLVGVFQNQPLSHILEQQRQLNLDIVQLHGSEPIEWASLIPVPVIKRFSLTDVGIASKPYHAMPLLDSAVGGTGEKLDIAAIREILEANSNLRIILAGGLSTANVKSSLLELGKCVSQIVGVDVSSGVEEGGLQSVDKIREFVQAAKKI